MESATAAFNPREYPDVPLYNIQAVASATGVPAITLRSWERRYGVPEPKRDPKGYRLYSQRDIAIARWLKERVQQGIGISRAVNMLKVLEAGALASEPRAAYDFVSLRAQLLDAIEQLDEAAVHRAIAQALTVGSVEEVSLGLLQQTLYAIGERWSTGHLSVTTEHFGSNLLRSHLAQLARISPPALREEQILIACAPGELHDIGALVLALFLRRRGFDVVYAGASIEVSSLVDDIRRLQPAAVCLSATLPTTAAGLAGALSELGADYTGILAFGGRAFNEHPELRDGMPGMYLGEDASAATRQLERAIAARQFG